VEVRGLEWVTRYAYGNTYLIAVEENGRRIAEFDYEDRRVSRVTLPELGTYLFRYEYDRTDEDRVLRTVVTAPDGSVTKFEIQTK
jgi:hypothetical protein